MVQQNKYRVIVSARAAQMLVSHAAFLAQVNPAAAERLTVEFEKAAKSLEQMPQRCPWLKGEYIPKNAYRFILFEKRYMLIFQIVDHTVYADHVVDCRQDYGWLIREPACLRSTAAASSSRWRGRGSAIIWGCLPSRWGR